MTDFYKKRGLEHRHAQREYHVKTEGALEETKPANTVISNF